jgi:hypothetical protein
MEDRLLVDERPLSAECIGHPGLDQPRLGLIVHPPEYHAANDIHFCSIVPYGSIGRGPLMSSAHAGVSVESVTWQDSRVREPGAWEEVVSAAPLHEADASFDRWLDDHQLARGDIPPDAVQVDTGRASWGSFRRYWIRRDFLRLVMEDPEG